MKKLHKFLAVILAVLICVPFSAMADDSKIGVLLNGKELFFDVDPVIDEGRTLVPLRGIFEALEAEVEWDDTTKTVSATKGETEILMTIGKTTFYVNGMAKELDVAAKIVDSRTMVPARAIAESFDIAVDWDDNSKTVILGNSADNSTKITDEFLVKAIEASKSVDDITAYTDVKINLKNIDTVANIRLGADVKNKLVFLKANVNILFVSKEIICAADENYGIVVEDGVASRGELEADINFDMFGEDTALMLKYAKDDGIYKVYEVDLSGEGINEKILLYMNSQTYLTEKVVIPNVIANQIGAEAGGAVLGDVELKIEYNTGETKTVWDSLSK